MNTSKNRSYKITNELPQKYSKDLRGVKCPLNFIKSKMELLKIEVNEELTLFLDDGEAIDNVPRSLELEGHEITANNWRDSYWEVIVKKR